jgi:hypothetical protein
MRPAGGGHAGHALLALHSDARASARHRLSMAASACCTAASGVATAPGDGQQLQGCVLASAA